MRGSFVRLTLAWIFAIAATTAAGGQPQQYVFKKNYVQGKEYTVLLSEQTDLSYEVVVRGHTIDHHSLSQSSQNKGKVTIQQTRDGVPITERVEFDSSCGFVTRKDKGEPTVKHTRVAGKTVTVSRDDDGSVHCDVEGSDNDPRLTQLFKNWLGRDDEVYPDRPVRVGDKWDITEKIKSRLETLGQSDEVLANCTLKRVREIKGGQIAELEITLATLSKLYGNIYVQMQGNGTALVDLTTGRVCRIDISGTLHACGSRDVGSATVAATGDGTMEIHQVSAPAAALAAKENRPGAKGAAKSASVAE
jgi:hypothetical protein